MLIDWLTLRTEITDLAEQSLWPLMPYLATMQIRSALTDELIKTKLVVDIDQVRSDFQGMVWNISSNGKQKYLSIGASPAFLKHGNNLFGSLNYEECKQILIKHAKKVLKGALLFRENWQPRRIDITQNFILQSQTQVKDALHILRASDGTRHKATVKGDSVYWGEGSHFRSGKAYDKLTQAIFLQNKAAKQNIKTPYTVQQIDLMQGILRLEMKLGRQYFDENPAEENITEEFLKTQHETFFSKFIGNEEVTDMDSLLKHLILVAPSEGRAKAAYHTYLMIKQMGYESAKEHIPSSTFRRHRKYLYEAGLSQSDLTTAKILELRKRRIMMQPVNSWYELEMLSKKAA